MNKLEELQNWQEKIGFHKPRKKMKIYYSPEAFAKTIRLIKCHSLEIGWNMVMIPYRDGYKVCDIVVYPQKVSAGYISVDRPKYGLWKAALNPENEALLNGQGHSHVNMGTFASITDVEQQYGEILLKGYGYYFFQIWNKYNEINSFFYDLDNKIYYTKEDIEMIVEDADDFAKDSFNMVTGYRQMYRYEAGEDFGSEQVV